MIISNMQKATKRYWHIAEQDIKCASFTTDFVHCEMAGVEQKELSKLIENPSILRPKGDQTSTPTTTTYIVQEIVLK